MLDALTQLMSERQKYEKWLRDLDAKKTSTPTKVFERVRADYTSRLQEVLDALRQHTSDLQTHARTLMVRLKELEVSEEELVEELSENQLRAQVGELSAGEWEASKKKAERMIAKFREDQEQLADDLNSIREILSDATGVEAPTPPTGIPRHSTDFNELDFLKSVVGQPTAEHVAPPRQRTPAAAPRVSAPVQVPAPAVPEVPEKPKPRAEPLIEQPKAPEQLTGKAPTPESGVQLSEGPSSTIRTSGVTEMPKTVKCAECGSMNYPSEWYCERCGAELANI